MQSHRVQMRSSLVFLSALLAVFIVVSFEARAQFSNAKKAPCNRDPYAVTNGPYEFPELLRVPGHPLAWVVDVAVKLDAGGRVQHVGVSRSFGQTSLNPTTVRMLLNEEALKSASQALFTPRIVHCKAVPSTYDYRIVFTGGP